jgi:hypothetical protein
MVPDNIRAGNDFSGVKEIMKYVEVLRSFSRDARHVRSTIDNKSGTTIPRLPHFQGFVEQEGKGRGGHTCWLSEKDTMKTWASGGDIGSIPLDTYREKAIKWRKKPSRSSSKPRGTHTRHQS